MPGLSQIRRLEAAAFRAWPAASTFYDGTWSIRLTPNHLSKRLNSINPLDPNDHSELDGRIARATLRFQAAGRELTFRQTPLASRELDRYFLDNGFDKSSESIVFHANLADAYLDGARDQIPLRDINRYIDASIAVHGHDMSISSGLYEVISNIQATARFFVSEDSSGPLSSVMCVQDGDLAGILDLATRQDAHRLGHAHKLLIAALKWTRSRGVTQAWLQVEAENTPALALYRQIGFSEAYRYSYRTRRITS